MQLINAYNIFLNIKGNTIVLSYNTIIYMPSFREYFLVHSMCKNAPFKILKR